MEFLEGKTLPGIAALNDKTKQQNKAQESGTHKSVEQQITE